MTQGGPLLPTIFNVMVDATVQEWGQILRNDHELGLDDVRCLMACFYADTSLIVARNTKELHKAFNMLFVLVEGKLRCPVSSCPQKLKGHGCTLPFNPRWHFAYHHPRDEVVIRRKCFPKCHLCGIQVSYIHRPGHPKAQKHQDLPADGGPETRTSCGRQRIARAQAYIHRVRGC